MAKFVLLFTDTGGGHRSAAQSIASAFALHHPEHAVEMVRCTEQLAWPFSQQEKIYQVSVNRARWLQSLGFKLINIPWIIRPFSKAMSKASTKPENAIVKAHPADVYVSCQPHLNLMIPEAVDGVRPGAKYAHVVTDLLNCNTAHFLPRLDLCLVPTHQSRAEAIVNHVPEERVVMTGLAIPPNFQGRLEQGPKTLEDLGLSATKPTVLLIAGGDGLDGLGVFGERILQAGLDLQLIAVCGRNKASFDHLTALATKHENLRVFGFVENVPELMGASTLIVTKAGPGTIVEACLAGLPLILFDLIPDQEIGNVKFVLQERVGHWCPKPARVVQAIRHMLEFPEKLQDMRNRARGVFYGDSAKRISDELVKLAQS